jgi:type IX secretion system PorP/SprF family membrane protein
MKTLICGAGLLSLTMATGIVSAQVDPHFSQFYMFPTYLNPALTGAFDGNVRVTGIYRNQWANISSPFSTIGLSADFATAKNMNFGASVLNQTAGDGGYNYTTAYGSAAFTGLRMGTDGMHRIVLALQGGVVSRNINPSKFRFGDQWNPITGYNPGNPTMDVITQTSSTVFDAAFGALYYDGRPNRKANFYAGASAAHLTQPDDPFSATGEAKLPMRFSAHAGLRINVNERFSITPNALYMRQAGSSETMVGAYAQMQVSPKSDFMFGVNYRHQDAVAPYVGFALNSLVMGFSYDANISDLGRMAGGSNAFEFSITFVGRRKVKPEVEGNFVCPRL